MDFRRLQVQILLEETPQEHMRIEQGSINPTTPEVFTGEANPCRGPVLKLWSNHQINPPVLEQVAMCWRSIGVDHQSDVLMRPRSGKRFTSMLGFIQPLV